MGCLIIVVNQYPESFLKSLYYSISEPGLEKNGFSTELLSTKVKFPIDTFMAELKPIIATAKQEFKCGAKS